MDIFIRVLNLAFLAQKNKDISVEFAPYVPHLKERYIVKENKLKRKRNNSRLR